MPGEYMYGFRKDSKLKPLVTFILYAGKDAWDGPHYLHDMLDFNDIPDSLKSMVSDYKINIIDIRKFENTGVFQTDVKQVFDFIRCSENKEKLLELVRNDDYYKAMADDAFNIVTKYTNSTELVKEKEYTVEGGKNDMCKAIQDLIADSKEAGIEQGIEKGKRLVVINMLRDNESIEKICRYAQCDTAFVEQVKREKQ